MTGWALMTENETHDEVNEIDVTKKDKQMNSIPLTHYFSILLT